MSLSKKLRFTFICCITACCLFALTACSSGQSSEDKDYSSLPDTINLQIGDATHTVTFEKNAASDSLTTLFPLYSLIIDKDGTHKQFQIPRNMELADEHIDTAHAGDIFLNGPVLVEVYYADAEINANRSRIGHIDDTTGLEEALNVKNVQLVFDYRQA